MAGVGSDARVSLQLSRQLGGVYRDPARVNRDASALLQSSVGSHLVPITAVHVNDRGDTQTVLVLQGTIAMHYRGTTYQLLLDMYLVPAYPQQPPVCYVRLAPSMYLKENHRHVGSDGKVYVPYLHEWRPATHNLVEMTVALSSVFSADPPVFTRPAATVAAASGPAPTTTAIPATATTPPPFSQALNSSSNNHNHTTSSSSSDWRAQQAQLEALMAREAAEANAAADAARRAEQAEQRQRDDRASALQQDEAAGLARVRSAVAARVHAHCRAQATRTAQFVRDNTADAQRLQAQSTDDTIAAHVSYWRQEKATLERQCAVVTACTADVEEWLAAAAAQQQEQQQHEANNNNGTRLAERSVDDICVPETAVHRQMLDLAAENASIADALYFLDRALYQQQQGGGVENSNHHRGVANNDESSQQQQHHPLTVTEHLRHVRQLAKKQFLVRAHLLKIQQKSQ